MYHMSKVTFLKFITAAALSVFLCSCAGQLDYRVKLGGSYEFSRSSTVGHCIILNTDGYGGPHIVPPYVDKISFDHDYICAQQLELDKTQSPPEVLQDAIPSYWVIIVAANEILGPMTEAEFDAWYATLGRSDPPQWISTNDQPALIDRWEELNPGQTYE